MEVNKGSFVGARSAEAQFGAYDALTLRSEAAKKAWAEETQAQIFEAESQMLTRAGEQAKTAGTISAIGSLLSGASTVGKQYADWSLRARSSGSSASSAVGDPTVLGGLW